MAHKVRLMGKRSDEMNMRMMLGTIAAAVVLAVYLGLIRPIFPQPSCLKRNRDEENDDGTWMR